MNMDTPVTEVDNGKLMSLISKNRIKLYKQLNMKKSKNSSLSSTPESSTATTPADTSDDNSSVASSTCETPPSVFRSVHALQKSMKRKNVHNHSNDGETRPYTKQARLDTRESIVSAYTSYYLSTKYGSGSTVYQSSGATPVQQHPDHGIPNRSHSDNSPHSFTTGSQSSCRKSAKKAVTPLKNGQKSQLWGQKQEWRRNRNNNCSQNSAGNSSPCLIDCRSCREYAMPMLTEGEAEDMSSYVALDCEFVGVGQGKKDALGRGSIVDFRGQVLFDQFVNPSEPVTDYRTPWSGLRPCHIRRGIPVEVAKEKMAAIIKDKVVVGHAVHNDFRVLGVSHPRHLIRDTAGCKLLTEMADLPNNACALKKLSSALLGRTIQKKEHCSVTDARTCLDLFRLVRTQWEPVLQVKFDRRAARQSAKSDKPSAPKAEMDLTLRDFFHDSYWPEHAFQEHHHHL